MNPLNQTTSSAPAGVTAALLLAAAGGLLAGAPASAQTFNENAGAPSGDFGNSLAARTTLTLNTTAVTGDNENVSSDPDFFTFTGLAGGTPYSLSISTAAGADGTYGATVRGYDDATGSPIGTSVFLGSGSTTPQSLSGTVPANGRLTIGVDPQTVEAGGPGGYNATLTASAVPEPATTSLVALGAALAALAARRSRKPIDAA